MASWVFMYFFFSSYITQRQDENEKDREKLFTKFMNKWSTIIYDL